MLRRQPSRIELKPEDKEEVRAACGDACRVAEPATAVR